MADGYESATLNLSNMVDYFYITLRNMLPFVLTGAESNNPMRVISELVLYINTNILIAFSEPNQSMREQLGITSNETLKSLRFMYPLLRQFDDELKVFCRVNYRSNEKVGAQLKEFLSNLMAELCLTFQSMRGLTSLSEENITKYDRLISATEKLSQDYTLTLQSNNIPNEPEARINYMKDRCVELGILGQKLAITK